MNADLSHNSCRLLCYNCYEVWARERHHEYPPPEKSGQKYVLSSLSLNVNSFSQCLRYVKKLNFIYLFIYDYDLYLNFFLFVGRKKKKNKRLHIIKFTIKNWNDSEKFYKSKESLQFFNALVLFSISYIVHLKL